MSRLRPLAKLLFALGTAIPTLVLSMFLATPDYSQFGVVIAGEPLVLPVPLAPLTLGLSTLLVLHVGYQMVTDSRMMGGRFIPTSQLESVQSVLPTLWFSAAPTLFFFVGVGPALGVAFLASGILAASGRLHYNPILIIMGYRAYTDGEKIYMLKHPPDDNNRPRVYELDSPTYIETVSL